MDRRKFIGSSSAAILSAYLASSCRSNIGYIPTQNGQAFVFLEQSSGKTITRIVDLNTLSFRDVEIPLGNPHSAQRILKSENDFIVFDFMGDAARVNILTGESLRMKVDKGCFMGHGTQTDNGEIIWCTEIDSDKNIVVRARRTDDLSLVSGAEFSGGHHVVKLPKNGLLTSSWFDFNTNKPAIVFFDTNSKKHEVTYLPENLVVSHLLPISDNEVVCITNSLRPMNTKGSDWNSNQMVKSTYDTAMKFTTPSPDKIHNPEFSLDLDLGSPSPLIYANRKGEAYSFWPEKNNDLFRFGFSIDLIPGQKRFASSHTHSNNVTIWNQNEAEDYINVPGPMGLIAGPDGQKLFILSEGEMKVYSLKDRKFEAPIRYERSITNISRYS